MDDDLKRWRKLGNDPFHHEPLSNGAVFHTKKKPHKHVPEHIPHKHPSKLNLIAFEHGRRVKQETVFVHSVLDRISENQKKDIDVLWSGHLNHNNVNKILFTTPFQQRGFKPPKTPPKPTPIPGEYIPKSPEPLVDDDLQPSASLANSLGHIDAPENMHEMMRQFDSVKILEQDKQQLQDKEAEDIMKKVNWNSLKKAERRLIPSVKMLESGTLPPKTYLLNLTKHGQYKAFRNADHELVQSEWTRKQESSKVENLKELTKFLQTELAALGCTEPGPDMKRLQVYRYVFDRIIADFKHYGPILAEIKSEYDSFIGSYSLDQNELVFLRNKVRKLLAQTPAEQENEFLNSELRRKLTLYAGYLPPGILSEKKREDSVLHEVEPNITRYTAGEDPITNYEKQIKNLTEEGNAKSSEIVRLKKAQEEDFVAKPLYDLLDGEHEEMTESYTKLKETHAILEEDLKNKVATEKEEQYHFLIAEYTGLTESIAKKGGA
ncbi:hypothetical protein BCR33DRAFT_792578 [Rhizoclosmatium globosum]|uniref:Translin-associated factor X-interacting protein 1 N-terminal domain-containing protein n=1 Tax=Rhizoclosmatium globosum TaxID=329046 RepID=A0A1Y2B6J2_9FUNG|nr:hypothetical protein BCR33DRAFT_792578 [Rhizoclosmatium globosum]|eukprot:ORY30458.1 hypothetical protein BCR33DRAFT_792578 [Rhizoclosmatium globosum]